jgi:hypothetical protein
VSGQGLVPPWQSLSEQPWSSYVDDPLADGPWLTSVRLGFAVALQVPCQTFPRERPALAAFYQPLLPATPLKGPATVDVIQPP